MIKVSCLFPIALMISVALISGLLFSFTIAVSPGLKHLSALEFLKAMKSINKEILSPLFLFCFFCPLLLFPLTIYFHQNDVSNRWLLIAGFLTYILVIGITATINVPLNNQLERFDLLNVSQIELTEFRNLFEKRWTFWNNIRAVLSVISLILITLWQFEMSK
ncbi:MAG: DUF1772 domain-containing protein [Chitinophagaceae bacterium]|nr:MAG: DUF1772 domain-containing protein [Chitinophagaceae bacterium]